MDQIDASFLDQMTLGHGQTGCPCETFMQAALEFLRREDFESALPHLVSATDVCHANYRAWGNRGFCLANLDQPDQAMICYEKAIALNANYALAWENKGALLRRMQRFSEALECLRTSIEKDPDSNSAHIRLGPVLMDMKHLEEACSEFDTVLATEPSNCIALAKKALALHEQGDLEAAFHGYMEATNSNPLDPELVNNFGTLFEDLGQLETAATMYGMALQVSPQYESATVKLERVRQMDGGR